MTNTAGINRHQSSLGATLGILFLSLALVFTVGWASGFVTQTSLESWYRHLAKPPLTPADWVFPVVWNLLYFAMALAAWRVWRSAGGLARAGAALSFYCAQLFLNLGWTTMFFGLREPGYAFATLLVLIALVVVTLLSFARHDRLAALLLAPYLAWLCFAAYLNLGIWYLNI